jgi:hypothetical protein
MSISRRELVGLGSVLGGVAMATAAQREGRAGEQLAKNEPAAARGKVASYSEGFQPSFTLSEMPEGITAFGIDVRVAPQLGRLLLAAAEKGWEIHVSYTLLSDEARKSATAYGVSVKDFRSH